MKKVVVQFNFPDTSLNQYEAVWADLKAAGYENPKGLISHVGAALPNNGLLIVDVWESEEAFTEFGKILMPLIAKQDIPMVQPKVLPAKYVYVMHPEPKWPDVLENF
jgi:hypothetical protein